MSIPDKFRMSPTHEWHRAEGSVVTVGITQFAADELTDITYVDLPAVGMTVNPSESFGEIESVKATSELFCAVSGTVTAINEKLTEQPELVNNDPHGEGWMIQITADELSPLEDLMDPQAYENLITA